MTTSDFRQPFSRPIVAEDFQPIFERVVDVVGDVFHGAATAKGALVITPEKVIVTTPGKDNKKVLD